MIDLKLAQYNSEGKFVGFLEIGKDFVYGGYYILITEKMTPLGVLGFADACSFDRDEKDPLNRFDGLFDGRTYGKGRFVLEINNRFNVYTKTVIAMKKVCALLKN